MKERQCSEGWWEVVRADGQNEAIRMSAGTARRSAGDLSSSDMTTLYGAAKIMVDREDCGELC